MGRLTLNSMVARVTMLFFSVIISTASASFHQCRSKGRPVFNQYRMTALESFNALFGCSFSIVFVKIGNPCVNAYNLCKVIHLGFQRLPSLGNGIYGGSERADNAINIGAVKVNCAVENCLREREDEPDREACSVSFSA